MAVQGLFLVAVVFLLGRANHTIAQTVDRQAKTFTKVLMEVNEWGHKAAITNVGTIYDLMTEKHTANLIANGGIERFMGQPGTRIRQEIRAAQEHLGLTEEGAKEWLRSVVGEANGAKSPE